MAAHDTGAAGTAGSGPGDIRGTARETIDSVRREAGDIAGKAGEHGRSILSRRKDSAAREVDSVADALRGTARQLEGGEHAAAGRYVGYAADRLQSVGRQLREKDVDALIHDAQDLGRRAPGAFFAGSVAAGFLLARFLKASSERAAPHDDGRDAPSPGPDEHDPYGDDAYRGSGADLRSGHPGAMPGAGTSTPPGEGIGTAAAGATGPSGSVGSTGSTGSTGLPGTPNPPGGIHDR